MESSLAKKRIHHSEAELINRIQTEYMYCMHSKANKHEEALRRITI